MLEPRHFFKGGWEPCCKGTPNDVRAVIYTCSFSDADPDLHFDPVSVVWLFSAKLDYTLTYFGMTSFEVAFVTSTQSSFVVPLNGAFRALMRLWWDSSGDRTWVTSRSSVEGFCWG